MWFSFLGLAEKEGSESEWINWVQVKAVETAILEVEQEARNRK